MIAPTELAEVIVPLEPPSDVERLDADTIVRVVLAVVAVLEIAAVVTTTRWM
jgi:hypothetical protein